MVTLVMKMSVLINRLSIAQNDNIQYYKWLGSCEEFFLKSCEGFSLEFQCNQFFK